VYNFGCNQSCSGGSFWKSFGVGIGQAVGNFFFGGRGLLGNGGFSLFNNNPYSLFNNNPYSFFNINPLSFNFNPWNLWGGNTSSTEGLGSPEKKTSSNDSSRLKETSTDKDKKITNEAEEEAPAKDTTSPVTTTTPATTVTPTNADGINSVTDLNGLLAIDYSKLSDADKTAYDSKLEDLLKNMDENAKHEALAKTNLPESVKTAIQKSLYGEYENYTEGTVLSNNDVKSAHDKASETSANKRPKDVTGSSTIVMSSDGTHPEKITITDTQLNRAVTYKYQETTSQGEYLYKSTTGGQQEYILQKKSNGEYYLVQYSFHTGYGQADQTKQANS
jgi:hypothetical protein